MLSRLLTFICVGCCLLGSTIPAAADQPFILLQSTTSTRNSGLYDYLLPMYQKFSGVVVRAVAVGTGQALANARNGDADVLLVHARNAEEQFVADGYGVRRFDLMYNDFVIVGSNTDPAQIRGLNRAAEALQRIARANALFVSRGDDSGTHQKERALWQRLGAIPAVRGKRIHLLFGDHLVVPGPRLVRAVEEFARAIHPEAF